MSFISTASTQNALNIANNMWILINSWTHLKWTELIAIKSNAAHMNATWTKRQIFILAQSGSLLEFNCRTGVHTPPQQTHGEGAETKAMYQFFLKQVAHLCALAMRWPKKRFIHYFNWPLPATAAKTSAPDVTSQSPMSESFGGIFFLPNFHGNQTFPSQARRPLHRGSTAKLRSIQSRREEVQSG